MSIYSIVNEFGTKQFLYIWDYDLGIRDVFHCELRLPGRVQIIGALVVSAVAKNKERFCMLFLSNWGLCCAILWRVVVFSEVELPSGRKLEVPNHGGKNPKSSNCHGWPGRIITQNGDDYNPHDDGIFPPCGACGFLNFYGHISPGI